MATRMGSLMEIPMETQSETRWNPKIALEVRDRVSGFVSYKSETHDGLADGKSEVGGAVGESVGCEG